MPALGGTYCCYYVVHSCTSVHNYVQRYAMYYVKILWGGGGGVSKSPDPQAMGLMFTCTFNIQFSILFKCTMCKHTM